MGLGNYLGPLQGAVGIYIYIYIYIYIGFRDLGLGFMGLSKLLLTEILTLLIIEAG